ncbi:MAG: phosphomannose isomerase type II C-terminal cupin domain [Burkholderiaceae bacterium]|nr:phosphomannose isomerase type II C-terminal cupin domain [Burkholderiaceae bacterium]
MTSALKIETLARTERPWGWFETVSAGPGNKVKRIHVHPGRRISLQKHLQRTEHWVVVLGQALVTLGEQVLTLGPGAHVDIAVGQVHRLSNRSAAPLEIIEVQFGDCLSENDIVRLNDDYGRA